eukprot:NODE_1224_length_2554_cov_4.608158.p1 GENE.NODE_1224_length_2554_cov_4.608158~~NODE_1224_length_2554_cov_4.608158.p1  ORF type:complete len:473 (+),score=72.33 NODE_1224_length_2554_cov_4.608158:1011-2429(+)
MAWAEAALAVENLPLLQALASSSIRIITEALDAQHLSNTVWAFATLEYEHGPLCNAISAAALRTLSDYVGQSLSTTFWSFSTLSRRDSPLFAALSKAAIPRRSLMAGQDISNTAWSCAQLAFAHPPLLQSLASAALPRIRDCQAQDLANTAWSFAYFLYTDTPLRAALSSSAIPTIQDFIPQNLATISWALEELAFEDGPLLDAISSAALRSLGEMEPMPIATLLDRPLSLECHDALRPSLLRVISCFADALLAAPLEFWRGGGYQRLVCELGVGNFGCFGCRCLYDRLSIELPADEFLCRANAHVPRLGRMMADTYNSDGADFLRQRVLTYAEYEFVVPGVPSPLTGAGVHENGRTAGTRWLTPVQPPFCPYADRGTCSEFRMLAGFCEDLARSHPHVASDAKVRALVRGMVQVLVSGPCCVSCVGAFAQFRLLFPGIEVRVAAGKAPLPRSSIPPAAAANARRSGTVDVT